MESIVEDKKEGTNRSKIMGKLTGGSINKSEECLWKHLNRKRVLNKSEGNDKKRKRVKVDSNTSRLSPNLRNQLEAFSSLKGQQVAARVTGEDAERDEWFVVKVIHFDKETREFEVLDEEQGDDEEAGVQRTYKIPLSPIIPFPKRNDPSSAPDFPIGKHVLAVYPGTTALFKATVVFSHGKWKEAEYILHYVLEFDDDEEDGLLPQRAVPFHMVVRLPDGHRH